MRVCLLVVVTVMTIQLISIFSLHKIRHEQIITVFRLNYFVIEVVKYTLAFLNFVCFIEIDLIVTYYESTIFISTSVPILQCHHRPTNYKYIH